MGTAERRDREIHRKLQEASRRQGDRNPSSYDGPKDNLGPLKDIDQVADESNLSYVKGGKRVMKTLKQIREEGE